MTYSSTPALPATPAEPAEAAPEEMAEETTATLPAGLFAGMAPKKGDVLTLRVVNVFDGEVEVAPQVEETTESSEEMPVDEELDQMASS